MYIKIKDFLKLCENDYCSVEVYDKSNYTIKSYHHIQEAINRYGYFLLVSWKVDGDVFKITTQTEF